MCTKTEPDAATIEQPARLTVERRFFLAVHRAVDVRNRRAEVAVFLVWR